MTPDHWDHLLADLDNVFEGCPAWEHADNERKAWRYLPMPDGSRVKLTIEPIPADEVEP